MPATRAVTERGFTLLEVAVGLAIFSCILLAAAATFGQRSPHAHAAALGLEAALVEARALASGTADDTDPLSATGATVYVAPDLGSSHGSVVSVYRSLPIVLSNPGAESRPLPLDAGFPPLRLAASLTFASGATSSSGAFAILISSSGYASVAAPLAWDPGKSATVLDADPGCPQAATIAADDGARRESHALACSGAIYDASS
ncbi:MAG: prepilin-type N-terminal cleavage/methylation domain-containing protein [Candidatus Eremiobacteraeota bacterium]|nr:prepilin-type N-terminal cleavage/methylation domain-containing protein [Candidatus Eremiobacteraeota bacterium]